MCQFHIFFVLTTTNVLVEENPLCMVVPDIYLEANVIDCMSPCIANMQQHMGQLYTGLD